MTEITIDLGEDEQAAAGILLGNMGAGTAAKTRMSKAINSLLEKLVIAIEEAGK